MWIGIEYPNENNHGREVSPTIYILIDNKGSQWCGPTILWEMDFLGVPWWQAVGMGKL